MTALEEPAVDLPPPDADTRVVTPAGRVARIIVAVVIGWLVLAVPGNIASPWDLTSFDVRRLSEGVIFGVIALSLNVLIGYTGQVSLGHQAFVGIGAFTSAYVVTDLTQEALLGILVAALVGGIQAFLLGLVSLRLTGLYFALVTLVYGVMAQQSIFAIESFTGGAAGNAAPRPAGFESDYRYFYFCLAALGIVVFLDWRLLQTKGGRAMLALRENPRVAQTWGIDTRRFTLFAFIVAGLMAGVGGGLAAHHATVVVANPYDFNLALTFVLMTTVGGLRNRLGVILGGLFFALLRNGFLIEKTTWGDNEFGTGWILERIDLSPEFAPLIVGPLLLLLVLTFLPGGFGQLIKPITAWLGGDRFRWHAADKEVMINDVRA